MFKLLRKLLRGNAASPIRRLMPDGWDAHAHILPGVDDGAADMGESIAIIRAMQRLGLRGAVCTPHVMAGLPGNTAARLREAFAELRAAAARECPGFGLALSAEYMADDLFPARLADPATLLPHPGPAAGETAEPAARTKTAEPEGEQADPSCPAARFLLIELPQYLLPNAWADMLLAPLALGLTPLLAHPERYGRLLSADDLAALHAQGVRFQGNIGSLTGFYGTRPRDLARLLLSRSLYSCWGSDAHSPGMLRSAL